MKNKKLIAGILTCSMIGGSAAASLSCFAENSPEAIITSATSQAANPNLTVIEKLTELKELCKKRLTANISALKRSELEFKIKNIDHNIELAQAGDEVPSEAFELPTILTDSTNKPLDEESSKYNWKKIAIGAGVVALTIGSGYAAYKFIPAVQDAINNNVLPLAQSGLDKAGNYTSSAFSATKNYISSSCRKLSDHFSNAFHSSGNKPNSNLPSDSTKAVQTAIGNTIPSAQSELDKAESSTSSIFSTIKSSIGGSCRKLSDRFSNAFRSSGNKPNLNLTSDSTKAVQSPIDKKSLKNKLIASGTLIACDLATILTCLLLTRFK